MNVVIPLVKTPNQTLSAMLGGINYKLHVFQNTTGVYISVSQNGTPIIDSVRCHDRVFVVRDAYLGFVGDLSFVDARGFQDPDYTGFGERYFLQYFEPGSF